MSNSYIFFTILTVSAVTISLRALPFISGNKEYPFIKMLREQMPSGVMCMLVIYTIMNEDFSVPPYGIPLLFCSGIVVLIYWFSRNAVLAIFLPLGLYLVQVNFNIF